MGCLDCDCDGCQKERQEEDERVASIIEQHASPERIKDYGICNCFYCENSRR
jgi:hypothetical protein